MGKGTKYRKKQVFVADLLKNIPVFDTCKIIMWIKVVFILYKNILGVYNAS